MALQNRKPFHFLCICWIILSYLGIIIIKAKQNCKYCIWHFNNQGYNVLVTRKRKTEYNPFKFPFIIIFWKPKCKSDIWHFKKTCYNNICNQSRHSLTFIYFPTPLCTKARFSSGLLCFCLPFCTLLYFMKQI